MSEPISTTGTETRPQGLYDGCVAESESSGMFDFRPNELKAQMMRIACDITPLAKRYRSMHRALFGFSASGILRGLLPNKQMDFSAMESELNSIESGSKHVLGVIGGVSLGDPGSRAKAIIPVRDALKEYANAVLEAALELNRICRHLRQEREGVAQFSDYSARHLRSDKVAYDAAVQELGRWGARLTELFERF